MYYNSRPFPPFQGLAPTYSRTYTPVQDSRSIPVDGTVPRYDNDQYQAQIPSTIPLLRPSIRPTDARAGTTSMAARLPHGLPSTATHSPNTDASDFEPDESEERKRQLKEHNERRWTAGEAEQGGDQPVFAASSEQVDSHPLSPQPPVTSATRTPEPRETTTTSSTLTSPHRKGRRWETESSTITAPLNADSADLQERERHSQQRLESMRHRSTPSRDREEEPSLVRVRPNANIRSAHVGPSNFGMTEAQVVDVPEEIVYPLPSPARYSTNKASAPPSHPLPPLSYNGDDRIYTKATGKARDKEKRLAQRDSRSPLVNILPHDEPLESGEGMRSTGPSSTTMHIDIEDRERYYQDRPPKPTPYPDAPDQHYPPHRSTRYPAQDHEISRPPPSRKPYGADGRDYAPPASPPPLWPPSLRSSYNGNDREHTLTSRPSSSRPYEDRGYHTLPPLAVRPPVHPPAPYGDSHDNPYAFSPARHINGAKGSFADREYGPPPAAHKGFFNYDDHRREGSERSGRKARWEDDRDHPDRDHEPLYSRGECNPERLDWERERNWDHDCEPYPDARGHPSHYAYGPPQCSGYYPTPPVSANRYESYEYQPTNELFDARDPGPQSRGYRYHNHLLPPPPSRSAPPEVYDYEYPRQESARAMSPTRQVMHSRRELGDRQIEDLDSYQFEQGAWKREREPGFYVHEDREHASIHGLPASYPSSSRPYEAQDYDIPPSIVHSSVPQRPFYGDNYDRLHAPPIARQIHDPNPYASGAPSHSRSHPTLPPSRVYNYRKHPSPSTSADDDNYERQRPNGARPPTNEASEKLEPAPCSKQLHFSHDGTRLDMEAQDRHKEEWRRKTHDMRVKEEEVRRKEDEIARREEEARQKEREAQRKAEEVRLEKEEAQRKAEEARRMGEEAQRKAEEAQVKEQEAQRKALDVLLKEEEAQRMTMEARRMQQELVRREYEAHTPKRPYSYPPATSANRQLSYPQPSHFRNPSPTKRTVATSSARRDADAALRSDKDCTLAVPIDTHTHLLEVAVSDSKSEAQSLNQPQAESHPGIAMDMGITKPDSSSLAVSNMAPEHSQFLAGARDTRIFGGTFATIARGNMIINTSTMERSGREVSAADDDEDADAESERDSSLQNSPFSGARSATGGGIPASPEALWAGSMEWRTNEETKGTKVLIEDISDEDTDTDRLGESTPVDSHPINDDNAYYLFLFKF